jgi:leucyl-tRNA synthetase
MDEKYENMMDALADRGYTVDIRSEGKRQWKLLWCHESWISHDLYQSRPLPVIEGKSMSEVLEKFYELCYPSNEEELPTSTPASS